MRARIEHLANTLPGESENLVSQSHQPPGKKVSEVPRYYFHIRRGRATVLDHEGLDLADVQGAAREAARRGRGIALADALKGCRPAGLVIVVADEQWSPVFEVPVEELKDD